MTLTRTNLRVKFCDYNFSFLRCFSPCVWPCALQTSLPPSMWWAVCLISISTWHIASFHLELPLFVLWMLSLGSQRWSTRHDVAMGQTVQSWVGVIWSPAGRTMMWRPLLLCHVGWHPFVLVYRSCSPGIPCALNSMANVKACQCQELTGSWVIRNPATLFAWRQPAYNDNVLSINNVVSDASMTLAWGL